MNISKWKDLIVLHIVLLLYSLGGICSKQASKTGFLSKDFVLLYGVVLFILFLYAILWQQILKKIPLNTAYANKSIVIIWGLIWGAVLFNEKISVFMIVGSILIIIGITMVVTSDE